MQLNKTKNTYYAFISFIVFMVLLLGTWWLYLVMKLANKLEDLNHPSIEGNLVSMIQWEGITFLILLLVLIVGLFLTYISDHKKTKSLQAFFSSLTHELKTPLASIKLQSQVLIEYLEESSLPINEKSSLAKYTTRIANDSVRLEDQLDKHLQLSRITRGAALNLRTIDIDNFINQEAKRYVDLIQVHITSPQEPLFIKADDFALQTIIRNLIENTIKHVKKNEASIELECEFSIKLCGDKVSLLYSDSGHDFRGETRKLGDLFYKFNSPQGSGLGLYIIRNLMSLMGGKALITANDGLELNLQFLQDDNHE